MDTKITTSQQETSFGELLSNNRQFSIPPFQRPYSWKKKNFDQLFEDLLAIHDKEEDVHFMGAIILDRRQGGTTDLSTFEVIDGQQRITTIYITVCAAVSVLLKNKELEKAVGLAENYLLAYKGGRWIPKISPSIPDRHDLNMILGSLFIEGLEEDPNMIRNKLEKLASPNVREAQVSKTYSAIRKHLRDFAAANSVDKMEKLIKIALNQLSTVEIVVTDPRSGPKIFDSLNSRQEPITTGDLIRNEIFGRVAREDPTEALRLDAELWTPFYDSFAKDREKNQRENFEKFFFPMGLIINPTFKKNDVFPGLRKRWASWQAEEIMEELSSYRVPFQDLVFGLNESKFGKKLEQSVTNLHLLSAPSAAYPFIMRVQMEVASGNMEEQVAVEVLHEVESFLVRRAICSIAPTGLHAVFKGLWSSLEHEVSGKTVKAHLSNIKTVEYPTDESVLKFLDENLYEKGIARYFVWEYDRSLGGDIHSKQDFRERLQVEHVLPQTLPKKGWEKFDTKTHKRLVHQAGNLIPLTAEMNKDVSQHAYEIKKGKIEEDSRYKSSRELTKHVEWTPELLAKRTEVLKAWAIKRWS
ncbi:DUF262 domain-containing HNH endonuclease family protein [Aquiluna sp.]|nr:DUF262 domain-containing HNH endonuclease family protein [Aquiluna sp.]